MLPRRLFGLCLIFFDSHERVTQSPFAAGASTDHSAVAVASEARALDQVVLPFFIKLHKVVAPFRVRACECGDGGGCAAHCAGRFVLRGCR